MHPPQIAYFLFGTLALIERPGSSVPAPSAAADHAAELANEASEEAAKRIKGRVGVMIVVVRAHVRHPWVGARFFRAFFLEVLRQFVDRR